MGLRGYQSPKRMQSSLVTAPRSVSHLRNPPSVIPSSSLRHLSDRNDAVSFRLVHRSAFRGSKVLILQRVKRTCSAHSGECFDEETTMNLVKQVAKEMDIPVEEDENYERVMQMIYKISENIQSRELLKSSGKFSQQFWTTRPDLLEPSLLGIKPEPPSWPQREKMLRVEFERKVNYLGIPISIRMIQRKLQWQNKFEEASKYTYCSMKKTFSSMVFIVHELQKCALQIRESLCREDLQGLITRLQSDLDASFVWLFQKILCKTPSLMVYTMVLLANFSVFSMNNNIVLAATPLITEVQNSTDKKREEGSKVEVEVVWEEILWNSMREEAYRLQEELRSEALDNETVKMFVAPVSVELEGDAYEEYKRTELYYKDNINQAPDSTLLLSNYAQFLYLVYHDVDKAEEYFRRAVMVKPQDAEALSRYADFLWLVRKDLSGAEMRYLEAMEADPDSSHYKSKYASFVWSSCGQGTCSPSSENSDNFDPVV